MTCLSLAEGSRRLGVDPKTLRRWLSLAHLPLQSHPGDGREKGITSESLQLLARLHHRSLTPLPPEPPAPEAFALPPLPAALLALPEQIGALQAQLTALEQQVAALTHVVGQHAHQPAIPAAPTKPPKTVKRPPKPPAPRARSAASAGAKPTQVLPRVEYAREGHYVVICPKHGLLPLEPDAPAWFAWLATISSFRFVGKLGRLTAHRELQSVSRAVWRAHRKIRNHTYNLRLGKTEHLSIAVLEQAAAALQAHLT